MEVRNPNSAESSVDSAVGFSVNAPGNAQPQLLGFSQPYSPKLELDLGWRVRRCCRQHPRLVQTAASCSNLVSSFLLGILSHRQRASCWEAPLALAPL